jgi:hypothetical protein
MLITVLTIFLIPFVIAGPAEIDIIESSDEPPQSEVNTITGTPVVVSISINVSLVGLDSAGQKFKIQLSYEQRWKHHHNDSESLGVVTKNSINQWTPVVYVGDKNYPYTSKLKPLFTDYDEQTWTFRSFSKEIVTLSCPMNLFRYPFDHQDCPIMFIVSLTPASQAMLQWADASLSEDISFDSVDISLYTTKNENCISNEKTSCAVTHLQFVRKFSYYAIRIYSPSFLIVCASLVAFWTLPGDGYVHRFALGAFLMFSLIMQQLVINQQVDVSSILSIHIWMAGNICFVFSTLVECAVAICHIHRITDIADALLEAGSKRDDIIAACDERNNWMGRMLHFIYGYVPFHKVTMRNKVDYVCFLILTFLYIVFVSTYCLVFLLPWSRYKHTSNDL